ncbi:MAG: Uma2 family endonuclease [Isosphaeraceae bacterium]
MATTTEKTPGLDHWACLPATWELYTGLLKARGDRSRPRYTFVDGRLTVVSPGLPHEHLKSRLGGLIDDLLVGLRIPFRPTGEVTLLRTRDSRAGTEADASYYLSNLPLVLGKKDLLMGSDPPPDLVVEVVVSHSERDALAAYQRLGVREVWICTERALEFLVLEEEGYVSSPTSAFLPVLAASELSAWVFRQEPGDEAELRLLSRDWVDQALAPRYRPLAGG